MKEMGIGGDENWPQIDAFAAIPYAEVGGDSAARAYDREEESEIIAGWDMVAVLQVRPEDSHFHPGFIAGTTAKYLKPAQTTPDGMFAMRVGREPVKFWAKRSDRDLGLAIRLVEITSNDDPKYAELPLY